MSIERITLYAQNQDGIQYQWRSHCERHVPSVVVTVLAVGSGVPPGVVIASVMAGVVNPIKML